MESALVGPVSMMALLTFGVSTVVIVGRGLFVMKRNPTLQELKEMQPSELPDWLHIPAKLLANLCESPIVFYAACAMITALKKTDETHVLLANGFVVCRVAHAIIYLTYNNPYHRFTAFYSGWFFILGMFYHLRNQIA